MNNDFKIKNESFWFDPLDEFQLFDEIVVVNISDAFHAILVALNLEPLGMIASNFSSQYHPLITQ